MKKTDHKSHAGRGHTIWGGAFLVMLLCLGLVVATSALAAYEQVGGFSGFPTTVNPEEVQLEGVSGMAVNYTGAGGVPRGTIYAATGGQANVVRYNPDGSFSERWSFGGVLGGAPNERCGPDGSLAEPACERQFRVETRAVDVDVDQGSGDVYVYGGEIYGAGHKAIHVYSPDGSKLIAEFGEEANPKESTAANPEKTHFRQSPTLGNGAIAVNSVGDVYLSDYNGNEGFRRLMEFKPQSPGDFEHYVYAGQADDLASGSSEEDSPTRPVFDAAGHIYVASKSRIAELDPSLPSAPALCEYKVLQKQVESITVNPETGEVFFYSGVDHNKIRSLGPCDEATGAFGPGRVSEFSPGAEEIGGLAFDPVRRFAPDRPPGVLYAGSPEPARGYVLALPAEVPPAIESESIAHITPTSAELSAQLNPESSGTRYVFQYETEAQYEESEASDRFAGATEAPAGGVFVGEGNHPVGVSVSLSGLQSNLSYRFRVVATSRCSAELPEKVCEATGEVGAFRTFPNSDSGPADGRIYELVSPIEKYGGEVIPADPRVSSCVNSEHVAIECKPGVDYDHFPMQSAPDGNAIVYEGTPFDSESSALSENEYIARRNPATGWSTVNLTPNQLSKGGSQGYKAFSAGLSLGVLRQGQPSTQIVSLSPQASPGYEELYTQAASEPGAFSPVISEEQALNRTPGEFQLEYAGASADLSRIFFWANDALTEETPFAPAAVDGGREQHNLYEWHEGRLALVNVMPGNTTTEPGASFGSVAGHTVSMDGLRAFFEDESHQVYVRVDGEYTKVIATEGAPDPGKFLVAAADGSAVLLADGHLHYLGGEESTVDLTQGDGGFLGVVGESEDLSHVYFVDTAVLDGRSNEMGEVAEVGKDNLYSWVSGKGTRFVARLRAQGGLNVSDLSDWAVKSERTAEASPSGRFLTFQSETPLTGYDNAGLCGYDGSGRPINVCNEVFVYDATTAKLACASCNPSGAPPIGIAYLRRFGQGSGTLAQSRYLTDEGRLIFDSSDSIVPADTNYGVEDVYEWEPVGVGSCAAGFADGGCVSLISAGTGTYDSNFVAMDPSGSNVFFTTRDRLSLKDKDELIDLYDARVDGGIAAESEVAGIQCQGESCQPPVSTPIDQTPGSFSFVGIGNVREEAATKKQIVSKNKSKSKKKNKKKKGKGGRLKKPHAKGRRARAGRRAARNRGGAK